MHLKIQWNYLDPDIYKLIASMEMGERSGTSWYKKSVTIATGATSSVISHEIGHVLGFRDHYFHVWQPEQCAYIVQINDDDLMSNGYSGDVTPEEWQELDRQYPLKSL
jgi:hypothetical protein